MKKAHAGIDVTKANFNALVEVLQQSMDARGIPFGAQNRLLAQLAPMHREIINAP
jgi:hemoglobin